MSPLPFSSEKVHHFFMERFENTGTSVQEQNLCWLQVNISSHIQKTQSSDMKNWCFFCFLYLDNIHKLWGSSVYAHVHTQIHTQTHTHMHNSLEYFPCLTCISVYSSGCFTKIRQLQIVPINFRYRTHSDKKSWQVVKLNKIFVLKEVQGLTMYTRRQ